MAASIERCAYGLSPGFHCPRVASRGDARPNSLRISSHVITGLLSLFNQRRWSTLRGMKPEANPFRDELEAALARIARLEEENARLLRRCEALEAGPTPSSPHAARNRVRVIGLAAAMIVLAFACASYFSARPHRAATTVEDSFKGIAVSPPPTSEQARSKASSTPEKVPNKTPCNCTPGDPLCSCL